MYSWDQWPCVCSDNTFIWATCLVLDFHFHCLVSNRIFSVPFSPLVFLSLLLSLTLTLSFSCSPHFSLIKAHSEFCGRSAVAQKGSRFLNRNCHLQNSGVWPRLFVICSSVVSFSELQPGKFGWGCPGKGFGERLQPFSTLKDRFLQPLPLWRDSSWNNSHSNGNHRCWAWVSTLSATWC